MLELRRAAASLLAITAVTAAGPAVAVADGEAPNLVVNESVFGRARAVGNTLMEHDGTVNFALSPGGSAATVPASEIPPDGEIVRAFLFWSGSQDPVFGTDRDVDFTLPDGTFFNNLSVDGTVPGEPGSMLNRCLTRNGVGDTPVPFFTCRREVTWLLQQLGTGGATGTYQVSDVDARPGDCNTDQFCQAAYGGWALIVMWESPTHPVRRDLLLYDAFFAVDEQNFPFSSGISPTFSLSGFTAGETADAQIAFMAFEGDAQLGVPPQNLFPPGSQLFCTTCDDFIDLRRPGGTRVRLQDANNQPGNLFNGSNNSGGGPHPGLDIDTFDIGPSGLGVVQPGDTSLQMRVGSGDGSPGGGGGGGELAFLGFTLLSIETFSPRFSNAGTEKVVLEPVAGPGETLNYILRIENDGSAAATQTRIKDQLPAGVSYVAGSTTNTCGVPSGDVAGTSPVLRPNGLNVGTLDIDERCEVRFRVTIDGGVADGTVLQNSFTVESLELEPLSVGPATTVVEAAELGQPTKRVVVAGGGDPVAGASLTYTIRLFNEGNRVAPEVRLEDTLPPELEFQAFLSIPAGATNNSDGGAGLIDISDITISANSSADIVFLASIAAGTPAGTSIENQGSVSQPSLPAPLLTDDPTTAATPDPTVVVVESDFDLTASTKTVQDLNGGQTVPGDVLRYTITVRQNGDSNATVLVGDDLPPFVQDCAVVSLPAGAFGGCQPGGANGTGRVDVVVPLAGGGTGAVVFDVTVQAGAPDGASIINSATLTPAEDPNQAVTVTAPGVSVFARPLFSASSKSVVDNNGGDPRPGDVVRYTITVQNTGSVPATNLTVTDPVPAALTGASPEDGGSLAGGTLTWTLGSLPVGGAADVHFTATIAAGTANGTVVTNTATIAADAPAVAVDVSASFTVVAEPALLVQKRVIDLGGAPFEPGDAIRYEIFLENNGDGTASDVVVRDAVDPSLTNVRFPSGGTFLGGEVTFNGTTHPELVALAPGDSVTVAFEADILTPLADGTLVTNQARVTAPEVPGVIVSDDPTTATADDPTDFTVESQAVLTHTKTFTDLDGGALLPGDEVEFVLTVGNEGNAPAADVTVTDPLDSRLTFVSSSTGGVAAGTDVVFASAGAPGLANVLPGAPVELRFVGEIEFPLADGTLIPNQAVASSPDAADEPSDDPTTPADDDPTVLLVESRPILDELAKVVEDLDGDGVFEPADRVRYTLTVTNSGSEPATNAVVTDALPAELINVTALDGGVLSGSNVVWSLGSVDVGETLTLRVEADLARPLDNAVVVSNQAEIVADGVPTVLSDDPTTPTDDDPTDFVVTSHPVLVVEKTVVDVDGAPAEPDDQLEYTITIRNTGGRAADDVTVTDLVDGNLTDVTALDGGAVSGASITWQGGSLSVIDIDATVVLRFNARIVVPLDNGTFIPNQAEATVAEAGVPGSPFVSDDPATPAPLDPTTVQVVSASDLAATTLESFDENGVAIETRRPGETIVYVLTVQNAGLETARDVTVALPVPADLQILTSPGGQVVGGELRYDAGGVPELANVAPGDNIAITFTAQVAFPLDDGTQLSLQATLDETGLVSPVASDDPSTPAPSDPTVVSVVSSVDLEAFEKTFVDVNGAPVEPGDTLDYVLRVQNTGDATARNVVVTDPLPAALEFLGSGDGGQLAGSDVVFLPGNNAALAAVEPGTLELRFTVRVRDDVAAGTSVSNQATVAAQGVAGEPSDDPATADPDDPTVFDVVTVPRATFTKDLTTPTGTRVVAPEEQLLYTFTVTSSGTGALGQTQLTDVLPLELANVASTSPDLTYDPGSRTASATVPPLAPGESRTYTLQAIVAPGTANGVTILNQATLDGADIGTVRSDDPLTPQDEDPTTALVEAFPDLTASTKTALDVNGGTLLPGDTVRYTLTIVNGGNGLAREVVVSDLLADELSVATVGQGGAVIGTEVRWDASTTPALAQVAAGDSVELTFDAVVAPGTADGTTIANQGSVLARDAQAHPTDDPSTPAADDATVVVVRSPELAFSKLLVDANGPPVEPGDSVLYQLVISNTGSAPAPDVVVTDAQLASLALVDVVAGQGGVVTNGELRWDPTTTPALASVGAGQNVTLTVTATVDPLAAGGTVLSNQAQLASPVLAVPLLSDNPATVDPDDATVAIVDAEEDYEGTVTLFDAETGAPIVDAVEPQRRVRARVAFTSTGNQTGQGGVLRVPFDPLRFDLEEATAGGVIDRQANEARWDASLNDDFRELAPGEEIVVEVTGSVASQIPDGAIIPVQGELRTLTSGETFLFGPADLVVESRPDLSATTKEVRDDNGGNAEPGDLLTWRITVINDGGATASGTRVIDPLPPGTVYVPGSTTVAGVPVPDAAGGSPLTTGLDVGEVGAGRSVVVTFQTRVDLNVLRGFVIENQALLQAEGASEAVSDDPRTPLILGDATRLIVGGGPSLVAAKRAFPTTAAVGDVVRFEIAVENAGTGLAPQVVITDLLNGGGTYVPGSMAVDGTAVTDAPDGDGATASDVGGQTELRVERADLEAGDGMTVSFEVTVTDVARVTNQASVAQGASTVLTDGVPEAPGAQPTVVLVDGGDNGVVPEGAITLSDENGGLLEPGDRVLGRVTVRNGGTADGLVTDVRAQVGALLDFDAATIDPRLSFDVNTRVLALSTGETVAVEAGGTVSFTFAGTVNEQAEEGEVVLVDGQALAMREPAPNAVARAGELESAFLYVGLLPGTGALVGTVFFESESRDGELDEERDFRAQGFTVLAIPDGQTEPIRTSVSSEAGAYRLLPLPPGQYLLEVRSGSGAVFARHRQEVVVSEEQALQERNLLIDPSGAVYNSASFDTLRGARAWLFLDDGDGDLENDVLVPEDRLLPGQQGQVTTLQGLYRFDATPGDYRISIEPADALMVWPSSQIAPERAREQTHPLGDVATPDDDGDVVPHALPDAALDQTYFLRFRLTEDGPPVLHNHIPVDRLRDQVRITKTANRRRVSVGDLLAYTVRVENRSSAEVTLGDGGVELVDTLPEAFRLIEGGWRLDRIETDEGGQQRRTPEVGVTVEGRRITAFGPFRLQPATTYELRYQVVVGPGAPRGDAINRALLRTAAGQIPISDSAEAHVRVEADELFDLGSVRAKVFCDDDGDGWQDPGELGLPAARVYLDTGHYAEGDLTGKLHFSLVPPGMHVAKIDERTLPPGSTLLGPATRTFYMSAGLPAQISYGAKCLFQPVAATEVVVNESAYRTGDEEPALRTVNVKGFLPSGRVFLDGVEMSTVRVDLGVGTESGDPQYGRAPGPNVGGLAGDVLRERLVFIPRVDATQPVAGWQLTIQREPDVDEAPALEGAAAPTADAGPAPAAEATSEGDAGSAPAEGSRDDDAGTSREVLASLTPGGAGAEPVYVFTGTGMPPSRVEWDGRDERSGELVLSEGGRYSAVLSVVVEGGDEGYSAARPFGLAWGEPLTDAPAAEPFEATLDARQGRLFTKAGKPTGRLSRWLKQQVLALRDEPGRVVVRVHVDAREGEATQALTAQRAQLLKQQLVAAGVDEGRVEAVGEGDTKPLKPNLRERDRKRNRRVEVRRVVQTARYAPVPPLSWPGRARVNGEKVAVTGADAAFTHDVDVRPGSVLVVEQVAPGGGRVRLLRRVPEGPFDPAGVTARGEREVASLSGDLTERKLRFGHREVSLALLDVTVDGARGADGALHVPTQGGAKFTTLVPADREWVSWRLRVMEESESEAESASEPEPESESEPQPESAPDAGPAGAADGGAPADGGVEAAPEAPKKPAATKRRPIVRELRGSGPPPATVEWDGKDKAGQHATREGRKLYVRLIVEAANGDTGISRDVPAVVSAEAPAKAAATPAGGGPVAFTAELPDPARKDGRLKPAAAKRVRELAEKVAATSGAVVVEAHTDDAGSRLRARTQTQRTALAVKDALVAAGVDGERVNALGRGSDDPKLPPLGARARRANRRVEIRVEAPAAAASDAVEKARVIANGRDLAVDGDGFSGEVPASRTGEVSVLIRAPGGSRAMVRLRPEGGELWQGRPADLPEHVRTAALAAVPRAPPASDAATAPTGAATDGAVPATGDAGASTDGDAGDAVASGDAGAPVEAATGDAGAPDGENAPAPAVAQRVPWTGQGAAPAWWPTVERVPAATLEVQLPPEDEKLRSNKLLVRGRTLPGNQVRVGGEPVDVDAETGEFAHVVELKRGDSELVIESEDSIGNKARVRRLVSVDDEGWFALLLADTAVGGDGAQLAERTPFTSVTLGDFFLYGRGVAYVKGRFSGDYVFRDYDLTLHLDTSKWEEEAWARDLRNPDLVYPVWGDSSIEVQDARARFPLYFQLKADNSALSVGNVRPDFQGGDFFRYSRARYGLLLDFDRGWMDGLDVSDAAPKAPAADPWRTRAQGFFTGGDTRERHARVEMWGTGGAFYFLRHELVVEGSERVALIVRDNVTGAELARRPLARNVDYTIRYTEGRLLLVEPLPPYTDASFTVNHNLGQVQAGHRVFVEVQYDHRDAEPFMGVAGGGHAAQTLFGHLELGGGYLMEAREGGQPGYQLGGVHAKAFVDDVTWVKGEWAWSKNVDAGNFLSNDGGLTYRSLGQSLDEEPTRVGRVIFPAAREGQAWKGEAQLGFGHWLGRTKRDGLLHSYVQRQSPGFFAGSNIIEQGQLKWGVDGAWRITDDDALRLRYDGVIAEVPEVPHVTEMRTLNRQIATAQYERRILKTLRANVEYGYGYTYDSASFGQSTFANPRDFHTNVAAAGVDWQVLEPLKLGYKQEVILSGDPNQLRGWPDHLVSHLNASWALTEDLALTGTESVRWSGENRTSLGIAWKVNDDARVYANERFGFARGGFTNTTVVGGETEMMEGTTAYGEYQLDSAFSAQQTRGVLGVRNRWKLPYGFTLSFGYERVQTLGGAVPPTDQGNVPPGAFTDGTFYAAPGANGGGSYFYGSGARDALSGGVDYRLPGWVIASQRLELRYDNFDEARGGRDLLWLMNMTNAEVRVGPEVALIARFNVGLAQDLTNTRREAYMEQTMLGASFRPITHDWFSALFKLSRKVDARPLSLQEGRFEEYTIHAAALEPIVELPWNLQLVEKLALKHANQVIDDLPAADAVTMLWINRVNWHVLGSIRSLGVDPLVPGEIDLGVEYRLMAGFTAARYQHGFLFEVQYAPIEYFRVGLGWNFTSFSDDELARDDRDYSGFFLRGVGTF